MEADKSGIIASGKRVLLPTGRLLQVAALVYQNLHSRPEILLITSRGSGRWIIPKGWPKAGLFLHKMAEREAYEEAGIRGLIHTSPVGHFDYEKHDMPPEAISKFTVNVYPLQFQNMAEDWPERGERTLEWVSPQEAASRVAETELQHLFLHLPPSITEDSVK